MILVMSKINYPMLAIVKIRDLLNHIELEMEIKCIVPLKIIMVGKWVAKNKAQPPLIHYSKLTRLI